jgi:hypothetical protein
VFALCQSKHSKICHKIWLLSKYSGPNHRSFGVGLLDMSSQSGKIWSPNNFVVVVLSVHNARLICYVLDFKVSFNLVE